MWEIRNALTIFVRKEKGKRPFGRPNHRCEENSNMDLKKK
jgi:hypothetical protein